MTATHHSGGHRRLFVALLLITLQWSLLTSALRAAPPDRREVWVPTTQLDLVLKKNPRAVLLTREQYETLLRDATPTTPERLKPPVQAVISATTITGRQSGKSLELTGTTEIEVLTDEWTKVNFNVKADLLTELQLDGAVAAQADGTDLNLIVRGRGHHRLSWKAILPISADKDPWSCDIPLPEAQAGLLKLSFPAGTRLVNPDKRFTIQNLPGSTEVSLDFGPKTGSARVAWTLETPSLGQPGTLLQRCRFTHAMDRQHIQTRFHLTLLPSLGTLPKEVRIPVPAGTQIENVTGDYVSCQITSEMIVVAPADLDAKSLELIINATTVLGEGNQVQIPFLEVPGVRRTSGFITLRGSADLAIRAVDAPGTQPKIEGVSTEIRSKPTFAGTWEFDTAPGILTAEIVRLVPSFDADLDTKIDFQQDGIQLNRTVTLHERDGSIFALRLHLPSGEELLGVKHADGSEADYRREGDLLVVTLQGESTERKVLVQTRVEPTGWPILSEGGQAFSPGHLEIEEAGKVSGYLAVSADASFRVETVADDLLEPRDGRMTPVKGDFAWFARGTAAPASLKLRVTRRPAEINVQVAGYVLPAANTLEINARVQFQIAHSGVRSVRVKIPGAENFHLEGPDIAERTLSGDAKDIWTITFQKEQTDSYSLQVNGQIPMTRDDEKSGRFHVTIPTIEPLDAPRFSTTWAVEANTDTEIRFESSGMNELDNLHAPSVEAYTPAHRVIGVFGSLGTVGTLTLRGERHTAATLPAILVDRLELSSVLSTSGATRHQVTLTIHNAGEQFMEVGLPEGAKLWSLTVDAAPVKPVQSGTHSVRIALPQNDPKIPLTLGLVYETTGREWNGSGNLDLAAPKLDRTVPVLRSKWTVWLPDGHSYERLTSSLPHEQEPAEDLLLSGWWNRLHGRNNFESAPVTMAARGGEIAASEDSEKPKSVPEPDSNLVSALEQTKIPRIEFREANLRDALQYLQIRFKELSGESFSLRYSEFDSTEPFENGITLSLKDVPALEALKYITDFAGLKFRIEGNEVVIEPLSEPTDVLITKKYEVPSMETDARAFLEGQGVAFPAGASASYDGADRLIVKNTQENLDMVDSLFSLSSADAPLTDTAGLLPLALNMQPVGQPVIFEGAYAAESVHVSYLDWWSRGRRMWIWLVLGSLAFVLTGRRRPILALLWGALLFTFIPVCLSRAWTLECNALLTGWMAAFAAVLVQHRCRPRVIASSSPIMKRGTVLALLLALHLSSGMVRAQETVIIPYDATKPVAAQNPDQRYVPYERFLELWDAAKTHKRGPIPPEASQPYLLNNARYEVAFDGKMLQLTATIQLQTYGEKWVEVAFDFGPDLWSGALLDGQPAPLIGNKLFIKQPGPHQLILTRSEAFDVTSQQSWTLQTIPTAAAMLQVTLPGSQGNVTLPDQRPSVERLDQGRKVITFSLPRDRSIPLTLNFQTSSSLPLTQPDSVQLRHLLTASSGWESIETLATFNLAGSSLDHFALSLPEDCQPVELSGPDILFWKLSALPGRQQLDITLNKPATGSYALRLVSERLTDKAKRETPVITATARRVETELSLISGTGLEFSNVQPSAARQISRSFPNLAVFASYALSQPDTTFPYEIKARSVERDARISTVYQVNRRKIDVISSITLDWRATSIPLTEVTIPIPADFEVETLQGADVGSWWRSNNVLHLRIRDTRPRQISLVLYLVRQFETSPASLSIFPIRPDGFQTVTGEAVIAAHRGDEAALELQGSIRQVAPDSVATAFSILPPLERKRAFTFTKPDFLGKVTLTPRPLKLAATWVTHVQAHEGWLSWQTKARFVVRQGTTRSLTFTLPADLPEARVSGPEVRETSSKVDPQNPKQRLYEVALQNDLVTSTDLTIQLDQSAARTVAVVEFPSLEHEDGYLIAENVSDYEMTLRTGNLEVAQRSDLPFLPELSTGASLYRLRPDWTLEVSLQRLEKTGSRSAFVAWAEITTAIRENGTEWNRAVYHLQNRSLQFLPVQLPVGGELIGARVAGENVRIDTGKIDGKDVYLIPLIKTRPGDISYDVDLVWRRVDRPRPGWFRQRDLDDPELIGITVERTLWNLWLPENTPLAGDPDRLGNMDVVIAEVNKTEKLTGMLEELKSLSNIVSSRDTSYSSKVQARENVDRLMSQLDKDTADDYAPRRMESFDDKKTEGGKRRDWKQLSEANQTRAMLNSELKKEKSKLDAVAPETPVAAAVIPGLEAPAQDGVNWNDNRNYRDKAGAIQGADLPAQKQMAISGQILLNDNIALQAPEEQEAPANGPQSETATDAAGTGNLIAAASDEVSQSQIVFSNARGSTLNAANSMPIPVVRLPPMVSTPQVSTSWAGQPQAMGRAFGTGSTASVEKDAEAMQRKRPVEKRSRLASPGVKGRVSLETDFPLEGRVWHFKKLKANARLDFRTSSIPLIERWKQIGWFALAGLLLFAFSRWRKFRPSSSLEY